RRHTRCLSDWSSDVCSSDLQRTTEIAPGDANLIHRPNGSLLVRARFREKRRPHARKSSRDDALPKACAHKLDLEPEPQRDFRARSEERRVGKEGNTAMAPYP